MDEKLIRDALGSPVPQHYNEELDMFTVNTLDGSTVTNGDIDFSQMKLLRDRLGSVIPQVWDAQNHKWVVVTTQSTGGNGGGDGGPVAWDNIQGKPSEFTPSTHTHEISEINGLQDRLDEVFTQVSSGKSLLETAVAAKGGTVNKVGDMATFQELESSILSIPIGNEGGNEVFKPVEYIESYYLAANSTSVLFDGIVGSTGSILSYVAIEPNTKYLIYAPSYKTRFRVMLGHSLVVDNGKNQDVGNPAAVDLGNTIESYAITSAYDSKYLYIYLSNDGIRRPCWVMKAPVLS